MAGEKTFDMANLGLNARGGAAAARAVDGFVDPAAGDPNAANSLDRPVRLRTTCMHLRHKLMYCDARHAQRGLVDDNSDTRVFLCAKTQEVLGPDDRPVSVSECSGGRACYCHGG
jgi:hypothetical protein